MSLWPSGPGRCAGSAAVVTVFVALGLSLQGCELTIPTHKIGNWQNKTSYLATFEYVPPGAGVASAKLNSCASQDALVAGTCSDHGKCKEWFTTANTQRLSFCKCDTYWADPECRTQRQSQAVAYLLSMFLGMFGADQFYMGFVWMGTFKLLLLGSVNAMLWLRPFGTAPGAGGIIAMACAAVWYVVDVVKIGSAQVYTANNYKLAADVPQSAFCLSLLGFAAVVGFAVSIHTIQHQRAYKSRELMMLLAEGHDSMSVGLEAGPGGYGSKAGSFTGYGTTLQGPP